ncbi:alginate export family protein [Natronospira bacteriovora]|uniref:Alginate export family protein n=1 Tax=Natronospira bacteriovora TaxID=3069753 RepID=A0ABU0W446_9GAMM|nr:alginate export family protein [Natronospira sp. AB-CW4]MDQ2068678.1 alginate export family protein [Natronospira sp. AB-CW4]
MFKSCSLAAGLLVAIAGTPAFATTGEAAAPALDELDLRYRLEFVDQEGIERDAVASTASLRLLLRSPTWRGLDAGLGLQANRVIGNRLYNDTVTPSDRPVVADPADTGISQAWLRYSTGEQFEAVAGRQRLIDDNARFIGNVGFRQLEQTFDALSVAWRPQPDWRLSLQYLDRAHRVFGPHHPDPLMSTADLDSWVVVLGRRFAGMDMDLYAHRFEFEDRSASHENIGLRLRGPLPGDTGLSYRLEYARQTPINELSDLDAQDYLHLSLSQALEGWRWFLGHERLSGDGERAFQTPFATLHAHNGWADRFLVTPDDGLRDTWIGVGTRFNGWNLLARLHDFRADTGGDAWGRELNISAGHKLPGPWATEIKLAHFDGDDGVVDVSKVWWTLSARF